LKLLKFNNNRFPDAEVVDCPPLAEVYKSGDEQELRRKFLDSQISEEIINQIKVFFNPYYHSYPLTSEQKVLFEKLVSNKELKERYKLNGMCPECKQPNTYDDWCQTCNSKHFQQDFCQ